MIYIKFQAQDQALNGHSKPVVITHANNTLKPLVTHSFTRLIFQSFAHAYPSWATLSLLHSIFHYAARDEAFIPGFKVKLTRTLALTLCSTISSTHWDDTRLILKNGLSSVLLTWKLHPDSLPAAGKGWLATKVSVCLLLTGSLGLEPKGSVLAPLRTWASRGCNGVGINNVSSYFQLKNI